MARITILDVKNELISYGWLLNSTSYKNLDSDLEMVCPDGHTVYLSLKAWRKKKECPECVKKQMKKVSNMSVTIKTPGVTRILALDDSTTVTGWSVFDGDTLVSYGKITMNQGTAISRIAGLNDWLVDMIRQWNPDLVALEDIQQQSNVQMFKILAWLQGSLLHTLFKLDIDTRIIHVSQWRSTCNLKGRSRPELKAAAQALIKQNYGLTVTQDEADAICIGYHVIKKEVRPGEFNGFDSL